LIFIENFLSKAKNSYISLLNSKYEEYATIRLLYGKQFRSMMEHLGDGLNIDSFLRYIANNTNNNEKIIEGNKSTNIFVQNYIKHYEEYNDGSLESISKYITTLFVNNDKTDNYNNILESHYGRMKIISQEKDYKGLYIHKCKKYSSIEEFIIYLFLDKIGKLPIAKNDNIREIFNNNNW